MLHEKIHIKIYKQIRKRCWPRCWQRSWPIFWPICNIMQTLATFCTNFLFSVISELGWCDVYFRCFINSVGTLAWNAQSLQFHSSDLCGVSCCSILCISNSRLFSKSKLHALHEYFEQWCFSMWSVNRPWDLNSHAHWSHWSSPGWWCFSMWALSKSWDSNSYEHWSHLNRTDWWCFSMWVFSRPRDSNSHAQ